MVKNLIFSTMVFFLGCATPRGTLTTPLDYLPKNKQAANTPADTTKQPEEAIVEHNLSVVKVWSFVSNHERAGTMYPGLSFTGTTSNNLFSFKLMITTSEDYVESTVVEPLHMPEELQQLIQIKTIAQISVDKRVKDYIVMPSVTLPILHYKVKFGFGSEPNISSNIELRTGMAYDLYIHYIHNDYFISFFNGREKKIALPGGISDNGYFSNITSINLDLAPIHFEANLILNTKEIKTAIGLGLIW